MRGKMKVVTAMMTLAAISGPGMIAEAKVSSRGAHQGPGTSPPRLAAGGAVTDTVESVVDMHYKRSKKKLIGYVDFVQSQLDVCDSQDDADAGGCKSPDQDECLADRKVTVYIVKERLTGERLVKLGRVYTSNSGDWAARFNGRPQSGWYVAEVKKEAFSDQYGMLLECTKAQSKKVKI